MKKVIIIVAIIIAILVVGVITYLYIDEQENKKLDLEAITLKENMSIEFGKEAKVSSFLKER